jgi:hypothetical protein
LVRIGFVRLSVVRLTLQGEGVLNKAEPPGAHRRKRESKPLVSRGFFAVRQ